MTTNRTRSSSSGRRGRPAGSPNKDYAAGQAQPSSCPACNSTNSHVLKKMTELPASGEHQGRKFNRKIMHRVQCDDCGQVRIDTTFVFVPEDGKSAERIS